MKKLLLLGIAAVALTATVPAQAGGLNLTGATGLARTPVAAASAPMSISLAADYVGSEDLFVPVRLNVGLIDGLEIGGLYYYIDQEGDPRTWGVNGKFVLPEFVENLGIGAGVGYTSTSNDAFDDDLTSLTGYAVATYTIEAGIVIKPSLGVMYEMQEQGDYDENGVRFFGSILAMVLPELAIGAEFVSTNDDLDGDDADADVWFGARYTTPVGLAVQAGMINNANVGGDDMSDYIFHAGVQYAFSFGG